MANPEYTPPPGPTIAVRAAQVTQYAGALVSVALIAGVGVWGYQLLVRDMTGVPVVRAMEGPVREAPANPGGDVVPHLGLSVNDVAAVGEASAPEETLLLAPVAPVLSAEDLVVMSDAEADEPRGVGLSDPEVETPVAAIVPVPAPPTDAAAFGALTDDLLTGPDPGAPDAIASDQVAPTNLPADAALPPADAPAMTAADVLALADQIAAGAEPLSELAAGTDVPAVVTLDGVPPVVVIDRAVPGVATALVPPARPAGLDTAVTAALADALAAPEPAAPALTTDIPAGTTLVQLGAYETPQIAAQEWDKLALRFADFLAGKSRVIQQASSGGRTFFRLRAMGYADMDEARRFCAALAAEDAACIPVVVR